MKKKVKKCLSFVGRAMCVVSILSGICGIIITSLIKNVNGTLLVDENLKALKDTIPTVLFILASINIITSILGIVAYSKTIKPFTITYILLNLGLLIAFLIIFIMFFKIQISIQQQLNVDNCQTGLLSKANEIYNLARKIWCRKDPQQNISCPCILVSMQRWNQEQQLQIKQEYNAIDPSGSKQLQDCVDINKYIPNLSSELPFLKLVEEQYKCNGICDKGDIIYYFTDVNLGPPNQKTCLEDIKQKIVNWTELIYIYSVIASLVAFLNLLIYFMDKYITIQTPLPLATSTIETTKRTFKDSKPKQFDRLDTLS